MKNLIMAIMATYIFYTDFSEVHIPQVIPLIVITFWILITWLEEEYKDYRRQRRRGKYLQGKLKRLRRTV